MDGIILDLRGIPAKPALRIGRQIKATFEQIAEWPHLGVRYPRFKQEHGYDLRSRLCGNYKIIYRADLKVPDIVAILHTKRDIDFIMRQRLG